jgi:hypothetical protein
MFKSAATAAAIAAVALSSALAQSPRPDSMAQPQLAQKSPSRPVTETNRNAKLEDAASINEDLIGFALEGKANKVAEKVTAMRKALPSLRGLLTENSFEALGRQMTDMEQASSKNDALGSALAAVEVYRSLVNAMDAARRPLPVELAMMDYSGFKLSILAAAPAADWATIAATVKDADGNWSALAKKVQDASLRNLIAAIQGGLTSAAERNDIHGVKFAAKVQLETVDVLEQYFMGAYKAGRGAAR